MRLALALLLVIASLCGIGYWYYHDTQTRLEQLRDNNAKLESANKVNQETINYLQQDAIRLDQANKKLAQEAQASEQKVNELRDKFIDHDLTNLSAKKPGLIEKRVNDGTKQVFDSLRDITK